MPDQKIIVIGNEEITLLLGLLGIEGIIIEDPNKFIEKFNELKKNPSIGMIIIALNLPKMILDFVIDFKFNNRRPLIFVLPDIFESNIENEDVILNIIKTSLGKIIT